MDMEVKKGCHALTPFKRLNIHTALVALILELESPGLN